MEKREKMEKDIVPKETEIDKIVEQIVDKWNNLVRNLENTTIRMCLMINEYIKKYPDKTVKEILRRVRQHPNIRRFVSIDRIWQGMRLIRKRPDLIEYYSKSEQEKQGVPEEQKPYLKKDGEVFWEFYFELAKQPLSDNTLLMLELDGKKNQWSFRQLRNKLSEIKGEYAEPLGFETKKQEKYELIKQILAICRELPIENLRDILSLCKEFQQENMHIKEDKNVQENN